MGRLVFALLFALVVQESFSFSVLTYNSWLIPVLSKQRNLRSRTLGQHLKKFDIIVMQEVFGRKHFKRIKKSLEPTHPYFYFPDSKRLIKTNSGLAVFSKWPILDANFYLFDVSTGAQRLAKKGMASFSINVQEDNKEVSIQFLTGHWQPYVVDWKSRHEQFKQMQEIIDKIQSENPQDPFIVLGDFNVDGFKVYTTPNYIPETPYDREYVNLLPGFEDVRLIEVPVEDAATYDSRYNPNAGVSKHDLHRKSLTLDYIFLFDSQDQLKVQETGIGMNDERFVHGKKNKKLLPYSDHWGVFAKFDIQ